MTDMMNQPDQTESPGTVDLQRFRDVVLDACRLAEENPEAACDAWRGIIEDPTWYQVVPEAEGPALWKDIWYHYGISAYGAYPDNPEFARSLFDTYQISVEDVRERLAMSGGDPVASEQAMREVFPEYMAEDGAESERDDGSIDPDDFDESEFTDEELGDA